MVTCIHKFSFDRPDLHVVVPLWSGYCRNLHLGLSQKSKPRDGTEFKIISSQYLKNRNIACHKPLHTYQPYTIGSNHNKHQTKNYLVSMVTRLDFSATGRNQWNIVFCNLGSEPNSISVNS